MRKKFSVVVVIRFLMRRLIFSIVVDIFSRRLGRKSGHLVDHLLPKSHFYPDPSLSSALSSLSRDYLTYSGWRNSRLQMRSVNREGYAVPWLTYPSIEFLESLNLADKVVLEFGGGASTVYFSRKSTKVHTIELDELYLDALQALGLKNAEFFEFPGSGPLDLEDFATSMKSLVALEVGESPQDIERVLRDAQAIKALVESADLILIDGGPRRIYGEIVSRFARRDATIIVDNTDRPALAELVESFSDEHYLKIPFAGMGPLNSYGWVTTFMVPRKLAG